MQKRILGKREGEKRTEGIISDNGQGEGGREREGKERREYIA